MHQIVYRLAFRPRRHWGAYTFPKFPSWFKGGAPGKGRKGKKGKVRERGWGGEGKGMPPISEPCRRLCLQYDISIAQVISSFSSAHETENQKGTQNLQSGNPMADIGRVYKFHLLTYNTSSRLATLFACRINQPMINPSWSYNKSIATLALIVTLFDSAACT